MSYNNCKFTSPSVPEKGILLTPDQLAELSDSIRSRAKTEWETHYQSQLASFTRIHETQKAQLRARINGLETTIDNVSAEIRGKERRISRLSERIGEFEMKVGTMGQLEVRNGMLEHQNAGFRAEVRGLEREVERLQEKLRYAIREVREGTFLDGGSGVGGGYDSSGMVGMGEDRERSILGKREYGEY